jgi:ribonuclease-3
MSPLEEALGHRFTRPELLAAALVHRSYAAEVEGQADNERFEFLGDAVLQLVITEFLFAEYPELTEGEMAKVRAASVNRVELAEVARRLGLGEVLQLGRGEEQSGGREKDSILGDAMEAVLAAVYLDGGLEAARRVILALWTDRVRAKALQPGLRDYKTRLQEVLAAVGQRPEYQVVGEGPDHAKVFTATVSSDGRQLGAGSGASKKEAEQEAARRALDVLRA